MSENIAPSDYNIAVALRHLINRAHDNSKTKGFHDDLRTLHDLVDNGLDSLCHFDETVRKKWHDQLEKMNGAMKLALIHSEVSEALEGQRKDLQSDKIPEFSAEEEELADAVIRIFDRAGEKELRLVEAIFAKMAYNEGRPYKHGKSF